jgi:hypothetical protein
MNQYIQFTYRAFLRIHGFVLFFLSTILTILAWKFGASTKLELWIVVSLILAFVLIVIALGDALREALKRRSMLPEIKKVACGNLHGFRFTDNQAVFLIENSDMFATDAVVSVYADVDGFEVLIGQGYVLGYTTKGLIQALIDEFPEGAHPDLWKRVLQNNQTTLSTLKVKPSVSRQNLNS